MHKSTRTSGLVAGVIGTESISDTKMGQALTVQGSNNVIPINSRCAMPESKK